MKKVVFSVVVIALLTVCLTSWAAKPIGGGQCQYIRMPILVVFYTNTVGGTLSSADITALQEECQKVRTYFWRNSRCMLNLDITYMTITEYKDISVFEDWGGSYWLGPGEADIPGNWVEQDLYDRGVTDNQYAAVVNFYGWGDPRYPASCGGAAIGPAETFLGAKGSATGYVGIPACWGMSNMHGYFIHEFLHVIDMIYESLHDNDNFHDPDYPGTYPGDENGDPGAYSLSTWGNDNWLIMNPPYVYDMIVADADQDGLPDNASGIPANESTFNSLTTSADSDADGLSDLDEYCAGFWLSSNPRLANTDGDACTMDGKDKYPVTNMKTGIPKFTPTIGGGIEAGWGEVTSSFYRPDPGFTCTEYAAWDDNYIYLAFKTNLFFVANVNIDANNDGRVHGCDNYEIEVNPTQVEWAIIHDWSSGYETIRDDLVDRTQFLYGCTPNGNGFDVEIGIPRNTTTGLTPAYGKTFAFRVDFWYIDANMGRTAELFEPCRVSDLRCQPVYYYPLDSEPSGWTKGTGWAFGAPIRGTSTHNYDPSAAHTGNRVYGYRIGADYQNNITSTSYLRTAAINCSTLKGTTLNFWRWLGVDRNSYDKANIQVSNNGSTWYTIWSNPDSVISDSAWSLQTFDISQYADGKSTLYIRWGMGTTNASTTYPGWSIDDINIEDY